MRRTLIVVGAAFGLGVLSLGCGSSPDDAGNRLIVTDVVPESGKEGFRFPAVEVVSADTGNPTGDPGTTDNGFCDGGDEACENIGVDFAAFSFANETRKGVAEGRPVEVTDIVVNYFDPNGNTPVFAPSFHAYGGALEIASDGTATIEQVPLTTVAMKTGDGSPASGIRGLFFSGQVGAEYKLTAVVDVFAEDRLNNESFSAQLTIPLTFHNPNVTD